MKIKISILLLFISLSVNAQFIYNNGTSTARVDTIRAKNGTAVLKGTFTLDGAINGILTTETDPVFNASAAKNITSGNISTWSALTSFPGFGTTGTTAATGNHLHTGIYQPAGSYLTSESDPVFNASAAKNITSGNISTWNALTSFPGFGTTGTTAATGNHLHTGIYQPAGSYLTSETDPVFNASTAKNITSANINAWNDKLSRSTTTVSNPDSIWVVVDGTAQRAGVTSIPYGYYTNINASGTGYNLTNTSAFLDFGTTDPQVTISQAGTWKIQAGIYINYISATVSSQTVSFKLRRTNNTASDVVASPSLNLTPCTSTTGYGTYIQLPPFWYSTTATTDIVQLWGNLSTSLSGGNIQVVGAWITAEKIYD